MTLVKHWLYPSATASLLAIVSAFLLRLVHDYVPVPYMDEEFHIRQAQKYCGGNFSEWDPKITTPPGLYLLSIGVLGPLASVISGLDCSVLALRSMNVFFTLGNFYLFYTITHTLNNTKDICGWRCALTALNLATFPTLYFFTFLYYTDPGSVFFVFLAYLFSLQDNHWVAAIVGAASLFFRQTNVVWLAFFAAIAVKRNIQKYASKQQQRADCSSPAYVMVFMQMVIGIIMNRGKYRTTVTKSIAYECCLYVCVGLGFLVFVWINDGIVLGDRSAHKIVIHIPQLFYLFAFILIFITPTTAGMMWKFILKEVQSFFSRTHFLVICIVIVAIALAIAINTRAHPYLLADNRHYPFYVWRKFFGRHPALKFVPIPVYLLGMIHVVRLLSNRHDIIWAMLFSLSITVNTMTQELLEFRYFIVPYLILRLQVPIMQQPSAFGLFLEFIMHTLINAATLYLFLQKPFTWPDCNVLQRFMW